MNTKKIEESLTKHALELKDGDDTQKQMAQELSALAAKMEAHRKANERPITAETLKQIRTGGGAGLNYRKLNG